jgi:predicted metal-dependent hydrolase
MQDNVKIIYKNIKYANIKIKPSLEIIVTVPVDTEPVKIDSLLNKRSSWIKKQLNYFLQHQPHTREYVSGETIQFLGKNYRLKIIESTEEKVRLSGGYVNVWIKNSADYQGKKQLIDAWFREKAEFHFSKALNTYSRLVGMRVNKVSIRQMKTRWGSCSPKKSYINLNLELIKKSSDAIEYVILHELTHLIHYNHTRAFYDYMTLHMPDWKIRKERLENVT